MHLSYSRTGGFAGFNDQVTVDGDAVTVTQRGKTTLQRKLTSDEQKHLAALAAEAKKTHVELAPPKRPIPDAFHTTVSADGASVTLSAPPHDLPAPWQKLEDALAKFVNEPQAPAK